MKNTAYAAAILGISVLLCGGSTGLSGCAASATPTDFGNGDDSGVTHSDASTHHDGGTGSDSGGIGPVDSGGGGGDSGGGGGDSGGGGGDSGGMMCGLTLNMPACDTCLQTNCCSQEMACANDAKCVPLNTCVAACAQGDTACQNTCVTNNGGQTTLDELNAFYMCLTASCMAQCP